MIHRVLQKAHPEYDPEYIQHKIRLIEKGLPVDITEEELRALEDTLRGARSFYIDILAILNDSLHGKMSKELEKDVLAESKNLLGVELALRHIDVLRRRFHKNVKN